MSTESQPLTDNETKFISAVMLNLISEIQFDTDAVAAMLGLKDGTIARARWNTIKRTKLGGEKGACAGVKKGTPKKVKKEAIDADGDDAEGEGTPVKTPKKRGRKPEAKEEGDEGEEEGPPKKKGKNGVEVKEEAVDGEGEVMEGGEGGTEQ